MVVRTGGVSCPVGLGVVVDLAVPGGADESDADAIAAVAAEMNAGDQVETRLSLKQSTRWSALSPSQVAGCKLRPNAA